MDLYFYVEQRVFKQQPAIHTALNLIGDAKVWFRLQNSYFCTLNWGALKNHLVQAFRPMHYAKKASDTPTNF